LGCDSKQSNSVGVDKQSWKLADGTEFNCWVSKGNHADQRSWVWSDLQKGSISYRIIGGGGLCYFGIQVVALGSALRFTVRHDSNAKANVALSGAPRTVHNMKQRRDRRVRSSKS
jgi:hypothetical protein